MRRVTVGLVGLLLLGLSSSLQAAETDGEKEFQSLAKQMVGGVWKGTQPTPEQNKYVNEYRWLGGDQFLRIVGTVNGEPLAGIAIVGVDPQTDKMTRWSFLRRGMSISTVGREKDNVWITSREYVDANGDKVTSKIKTTLLGKDKLQLEMAEREIDGVKQDLEVRPPWIWNRHQESYADDLLAAVPDDVESEATTDAAKALKAYGELAVGGTWKATQNEGEMVDGVWKPTGEVSQLTHRYRWFAGKRFLQLSATNNGEKSDVLMILGVDPETNKFTQWTFGKLGVSKTTITQQDDDTFLAQSESTNKKGERVSWKGKITKVGDDETHQIPTELAINGQPARTRGVPQVWKRHKE